MNDKYRLAAFGALCLWFSLAALALFVLRAFGWTKVKQFKLELAFLIVAVLSLPTGAAMRIVWPYKSRVLARLHLLNEQSRMVLLTPGCTVLPANDIWNAPIADLPQDGHSAAYIQSMGPNIGLHADFGATSGIPYNVVEGGPEAKVTFEDGDESDPGPYIIPDNAVIENDGYGDAHVLVVDQKNCKLFEIFKAKRVGNLEWEAGSGAIFDFRSNALRTAGWTSADAAGLPIFPGLVRYQEVTDGQIKHALRFSTAHTRGTWAWPARHRGSRNMAENLPAMGQRFRLRRTFDVSGFSLETQVILTALKEYGLILADNGGSWYITGAPDTRWPRRISDELKRVVGSDFEAVDVSSLMVNKDSGEVRR